MTPTFSNRAVFQPAGHADQCCCPACAGLECLERTRYFSGQLLTEADLNNEQSYLLAKNRLHNRYLHGWGVVCGLQVVCGDCDGWVTVKPGYAIDPCGNDVIVCEAQPFDVMKAIQACCAPAPSSNCSPRRAAPPPDCREARQQWCITLQYEEQPVRPITPLRPAKGGSCGCGGSVKGGCSCGGSGGGAKGCGCKGSARAGGCCCSTQSLKPPSTAPGCEPTRILEGFRLGICPVPETKDVPGVAATFTNTKLPAKSTASIPCLVTLRSLIDQAPVLTGNATSMYASVCNYLRLVRNTIASSFVTHCQILADLTAISVPAPGNEATSYKAALTAVIDTVKRTLQRLFLDCFCISLLPTCPPAPCDNCLVLACVTVQDGKIIDICHFGGGRQQVITIPAIRYWLDLFGFERIVQVVTDRLQQLCCGDRELPGLFLGMSNNLLYSNLFGNPAFLNELFANTVAQVFGANPVNAISPDLKTIDLRPLVGLSLQEAQRTLRANDIPADIQNVPPAWMDTSVELAREFAPSAHPSAQPITVYVRGKIVAGFETPSALQQKLNDLQAQIDTLKSRMG